MFSGVCSPAAAGDRRTVPESIPNHYTRTPPSRKERDTFRTQLNYTINQPKTQTIRPEGTETYACLYDRGYG